jgi:DNA-damage-inducible protein D
MVIYNKVMDLPAKVFEQIKKINEYGSEYWSAREMAKILDYQDYRNFVDVLIKAKESCNKAHQIVADHFGDVTDMVKLGSSASRTIPNIHLSRYACYLIMQNADPSKEIVALGQTYFAIQTRRQEVQDKLMEDQKRLYLRGEITAHNKRLAETASRAGVENYATFTNYGYMGLYGGMDMKQIHQRKKLKKTQKILDFMGSEELAANLFRATQTDAKLKREYIQGEAKANQTHFEVGRKVRKTIKELGGTMPEQLPTAENIRITQKRLKNDKTIKYVK